jgi:hypothetical protein
MFVVTLMWSRARCSGLAYDFGDVADVIIVVHETQSETPDQIHLGRARPRLADIVQVWLIGPHRQAHQPHAATLL